MLQRGKQTDMGTGKNLARSKKHERPRKMGRGDKEIDENRETHFYTQRRVNKDLVKSKQTMELEGTEQAKSVQEKQNGKLWNKKKTGMQTQNLKARSKQKNKLEVEIKTQSKAKLKTCKAVISSCYIRVHHQNHKSKTGRNTQIFWHTTFVLTFIW